MILADGIYEFIPSPVTWAGLFVEGYAARYIATPFCRKMVLQRWEGGINETERVREFDVSTSSDVEEWATESGYHHMTGEKMNKDRVCVQ